MLGHDEIVPDTHILVKGDFKNKGEKVEPGFLSALNPGPRIEEPKGVLFVPQRRKALAQWLTSRRSSAVQPCDGESHLARTFRTEALSGRPMISGGRATLPHILNCSIGSLSNFGQRGWSIKQMHRLMMLSNTYQTSSVADTRVSRRIPRITT